MNPQSTEPQCEGTGKWTHRATLRERLRPGTAGVVILIVSSLGGLIPSPVDPIISLAGMSFGLALIVWAFAPGRRRLWGHPWRIAVLLATGLFLFVFLWILIGMLLENSR
jgi:hypothetical protein